MAADSPLPLLLHDLNNSLTVIRAQAELLATRLSDADHLRRVGEIADAARKATEVVRQLQSHAEE